MKRKKVLEILKKAKRYYLAGIREHYYKGMCYYIGKVLFKSNVNFAYNTIQDYIPKFTPKFCGGKPDFLGYWWDTFDTISRIKAFDKLIDYYSKPTLTEKIIKLCKKLLN